MFYYYGRKALIAKLYPEPLYDTIVEPFAGSAAYSLHGDRWQNRVMLNDLDPGVAAAWRWLINDATPADVLGLPRMKQGDKLDAHTHLSDGERWFMVYNINPAACQNSNVCSRNGADRLDGMLTRTAENLHKVKHWTFTNSEYLTMANIEATWFIDPPYFTTGHEYMTNTVDFDVLREWCLDRNGQIIVCENSEATWLPFHRLVAMTSGGHQPKNGQKKKRSFEVMWSAPQALGNPSMFDVEEGIA